MPPNCIFCTVYRQHYSSTNFITNCLGAPYKTYNSYRVNTFYFSLLTTLLTLYIGEKKGTVLMTTFSEPSTAYKPTYSRYCLHYFRRCLRYHFSLYFPPPYTARIGPATTACINSATTYYSPPYRGAARSWSYYYLPYRAARS
jgi:hypothetical protein